MIDCIDKIRSSTLNDLGILKSKNLYKLLNLNPHLKHDVARFDGSAVIEEVEQNPHLAEIEYRFVFNAYQYPRHILHIVSNAYPLHQAIMLGAKIDVIEAIYYAYPPAIKEKFDFTEDKYCKYHRGLTALHLAFEYGAPLSVKSFLLSKWPEATREKDISGAVPLHYACNGNTPIGPFSLLLEAWPGAAMKKRYDGKTPLHCVCENEDPSLEKVTLLLDHYPCASEEIAYGLSPIAIRENILRWKRDYSNYGDGFYGDFDCEYYCYYDDTHKILSYNRRLNRGKINDVIAKEMMGYFVSKKCWNGVVRILDCYPPLAQNIQVDVNVSPEFLSLLGQRCNLKTLSYALRNEVGMSLM